MVLNDILLCCDTLSNPWIPVENVKFFFLIFPSLLKFILALATLMLMMMIMTC